MESWWNLTKRHVKINLTPQEYEQITQPWRNRYTNRLSVSLANDVYWNCMPCYILARCPICNASRTALLDTYSLHSWLVEKRGEYVFSPEHQEVGCEHAVAIQNFIHRRGLAPPKGENFFNENSEVPFIMPILLPDDIESYAVLHTIPVCQAEGEQFTPRYAVFIVAYYGAQPLKIRKRREDSIAQQDSDWPPSYFMFDAGKISKDSDIWDLTDWMRKGKLLWLDLTRDDLPLRSWPDKGFPYGNIEGIRRPHIYHRDGKLSLS